MAEPEEVRALWKGWAQYWSQTIAELRAGLVRSSALDDRSIDTFLARCADPA